MVHIGKNTRSRIVSKGISAGRSRNAYRGLVSVRTRTSGVELLSSVLLRSPAFLSPAFDSCSRLLSRRPCLASAPLAACICNVVAVPAQQVSQGRSCRADRADGLWRPQPLAVRQHADRRRRSRQHLPVHPGRRARLRMVPVHTSAAMYSGLWIAQVCSCGTGDMSLPGWEYFDRVLPGAPDSLGERNASTSCCAEGSALSTAHHPAALKQQAKLTSAKIETGAGAAPERARGARGQHLQDRGGPAVLLPAAWHRHGGGRRHDHLWCAKPFFISQPFCWCLSRHMVCLCTCLPPVGRPVGSA